MSYCTSLLPCQPHKQQDIDCCRAWPPRQLPQMPMAQVWFIVCFVVTNVCETCLGSLSSVIIAHDECGRHAR